MSYESSPRSAESTHALDYKKSPVDRMIDPFRKSFEWLLAPRAGAYTASPAPSAATTESKSFLPMPAMSAKAKPSPTVESEPKQLAA